MPITDLTSLSRGGGSGGPSTAAATSARGVVARTPGSDAESLIVTVSEFSIALAYEVPTGQWGHASNLPAAGASCLVVFDELGDVWVPLWAGMEPSGGVVDTGGGDKHYSHAQGAPAAIWTIVHNLGKFPSITCYDSAGDMVEGEQTDTTLDTSTIQFSAAFAGHAECN